MEPRQVQAVERRPFTAARAARRQAAVLVVAAVALAACAAEPKQSTPDEERRVMFDCANGERIEMRFFPARGVAVMVRSGESIELQQQISGSGFIYSNGPNTVRGKGKELTVEIGRMAPFQCTAQ